MYKKGLFHDWVPKPVQLLLILIGYPPFILISGVYSGNISQMAGSMQAMPEFFSMANNMTYIGMMVVMPLVFRMKQYFRSKELVVGGLLLMILLSFVCYHTDSEKIIILCTLLIGTVKMFGMIEFIIPIMFMISPSMKRKVFYPIFYPIAIGLGQVGGYAFTLIAYYYNWERVYFFAIIYMLVIALLFTIFMHNSRSMRKVPLYQFHWMSLLIFTAILVLMSYLFNFSKYHAWFSSPVIACLAITIVVLTSFFIYRQMTLKRPYLTLTVFKRRNVYTSIILIGLMGIFSSTSSIQSIFFKTVLGYSNETNALLNLTMLPGVVFSGFISHLWFKHGGKLKPLVLIGFSSFIAAHLILYFLFAPVVEINYFIFPIFLKGAGMGFLYISLATYNARNLAMQEMFSAATILIISRSFLGPGFFGSILTWAFYKLQLQNGMNLITGMDATDSLGLIRGGGLKLYGPVQIQSILLAAKQLFGYIIVAGIVCLIIILLHRFEQIHHRRLVLISKRLKGHNISGYKLKSATAEAIPVAV